MICLLPLRPVQSIRRLRAHINPTSPYGNSRMLNHVLRRVAILTLVIAGIGVPASNAAATEWQWSKPINQKPGSLLYTTNVRAKQSSSSRSVLTSTWYPSSQRKMVYRPMRRPFFFCELPGSDAKARCFCGENRNPGEHHDDQVDSEELCSPTFCEPTGLTPNVSTRTA